MQDHLYLSLAFFQGCVLSFSWKMFNYTVVRRQSLILRVLSIRSFLFSFCERLLSEAVRVKKKTHGAFVVAS